MTISTYLTVNITGLVLIAFIIWWFWLAKSKKQQIATDATIQIEIANGIYVPDTIKTKVGQTLKLEFTRKDPSPCAEAVIFAELEISADLPLDQAQQLNITPTKTGKFEFTCPMGMYRGLLIVE